MTKFREGWIPSYQAKWLYQYPHSHLSDQHMLSQNEEFSKNKTLNIVAMNIKIEYKEKKKVHQ